MRRELAYRATHDALTGVANRDDLLERLRVRLALDTRHSRPAGLLFLDVDNLKAVNDDHGHHVGDAVLVAVAQRLTAAVRREDLVARLSGDEFVVMVENVEDSASLARVAENCRTAVHAGIEVDGVLVPVSLSIGGALAAADERAEDLLVRADRAVYRAKRAGRDQVSIAPTP